MNEIINIIIVLIFLFWTFIYINSIFNSIKNRIPQVSSFDSDLKAMKKWLKKYDLKWKKLIDLGSGIWKILRFFSREFHMKTTWYEIDLSNYLIALLLNKIYGVKSEIHLKSLYEADLKKYDYIYMYSYPEVIQDFWAFIKNNAKPWTIVFSNWFRVPDLETIDIVLWKDWKEEVFVYKV